MHEHDHGLTHDLSTLMRHGTERRRALRWLGAGSVAPLALLGCGGEHHGEAVLVNDTPTTGGSISTAPTSCTLIPEETAGPYPGDGSNSVGGSGVNALALTGIVRTDIRSSIAGASGLAVGVPLTVTLRVLNTNGACATLQGYAVYLWHCDREGRYSMYSAGVTAENYLRGVQVADANGQVSFTTIFPGCYAGRWPHIHFEVYRSLGAATSATGRIKTSQIALPAAACGDVFATSGYSASVTNFSQISLAKDEVFSDGATLQTPTITGNASSGYAITLDVGVAG